MTKDRKWLVLAVAGVAATVACEQSPTMVPADELSPAAVIVPEDHAAGAQVVVCKEGPAGTFNFTVTANPPGQNTTGTISLPEGDSFTLVNDECKIVATTNGALQSVTVVELAPPAGTLFEEVEVFEFFTGTGVTQSDRVEEDPEVTLSPFGNDRGLVVVYRNMPDPSTGCTLTQGYWKTHNETFEGGAPPDARWDNVGLLAENEMFFASGQTWFEVFWTAPAGNAYYSLAHQYMAAKLNIWAGASAPQAVLDAITAAEALFGTAPTSSPTYVGGLKGNDATRQQFLTLAGILGSYNEGLTGPGHCGD